ncbi:MAG: ABC transporter ATP-binding protein [Deltaproteobacteria bacterium]|nr:ABC transporter ATP-binding protein [Deltaproteobacteria bacterium]
MAPILSLRNVELRRGTDFILNIERLDFRVGGFYLLVGPNGAGKSTLLQFLGMLLPPERGRLFFDGTEVRGAVMRQRLRRQITLVEQAPFLFDASVYDNIAFGLRLRGVRGDLQRRRVKTAMDMLGLQGFEKRPAKALSGGEIRRVALARAMVLRPRALLLDEPTAGLDQSILPVFEGCLKSLRDDGVTILISTHDAAQVRRLSGELLGLEGGRLVAPESSPISRLHIA